MNGVLDAIYFKSESIRKEWAGTKPTLRLILADMKDYCVQYQMPFCITDLTSTEAEDIKYKRVSTTHRDGRAGDLRCKTWPEWFITQFCEHFESKYKSVAAQVGTELKSKLIVRHVGTEDHLHVQIRRNV
jgi:hypothetical protein